MKAVAFVLVSLLGGCLFKPDRVDVVSDAHNDGAGSGSDAAGNGLAVRIVKNAWFVAGFSNSPGMTSTGYSIPTTGIHTGDLVLFIANVDNGSDSVINPLDIGFSPLVEHFFGSDGQTYGVFYKIATASEPATYGGAWGSGISSAAATITLLAVTGYNTAQPINAVAADDGATGPGTDPVRMTSAGVTTTVPGALLIYAGGADWVSNDSSATFSIPSGFTKLVAFGDKGETTANFQWTTQMIASAFAGSAGSTGSIHGVMQSTTAIPGIPWAVTIAVAPAP